MFLGRRAQKPRRRTAAGAPGIVRITPALDAEAFEEAWERLYDGRIETERTLLRAEPCTVSVTQNSTRITWTIRPVLFLPLGHRRSAELSSCAHNFKRHTAP